ncbi:MAG: hypothetical protein KUF75_13230 [Candidatus Thiodiazotropha sp. (ex Ctena orbiculata)]|nr:hypothetical protein [Candidatus Thiodiazotropha taylori]
MTEGFLRQRRNLFVVNAILLFCYYAQVNISKLTIAGMSFDSLGSPAVVYVFLWVVWAYFVYRYIVFYIEDEKETVKNIWRREFESRVSKVIKNIILNEGLDVVNENARFSYYEMKNKSMVVHYQIYVANENNERVAKSVQRKIKRKEVIYSEVYSAIYFSLFTPILTNYLLPIIVCLYVIVICGFANWDGSVLSIFT